MRRRNGALTMIDWGQGGERIRKLPEGVSVSLEQLRDSKSHDWGPWLRSGLVSPVKVAVSDFQVTSVSEPDPMARWVALEPGQFLQGALVRRYDVCRVYLVRTQAPVTPFPRGVRPFWPRIIGKSLRDTALEDDDEDAHVPLDYDAWENPRYEGPLLDSRRGEPEPAQRALLDSLAPTLRTKPWWRFVAPPTAPCAHSNGTLMRNDHNSWRSILPPCAACPGGCTIEPLTYKQAREAAKGTSRELLFPGIQTKR